MKVLITGIAGFIGSHTVEQWKGKKDKIWGIDDFSSGKAGNIAGFVNKMEDVFQHNISDRDSVFKTFNYVKPDVVLHLAAQPSLLTSIEKPSLDIVTNVWGTMQILEAAKFFGVKHFVFSSTSAVSETRGAHFAKMGFSPEELPTFPYGISKLAAEMYIRFMFPDNHTIFRYANIYGPRQVPLGENQLVPRAIRHALYGDNFEIYGDGTQTRDYTFVKDVAKANWLACTKKIPGTYYVATGYQYSVNEVLEHVGEALDYSEGWKHGAPRQDRQEVILTNKELDDAYHWHPSTTLKDGIQQTVDWWKKQERDNG